MRRIQGQTLIETLVTVLLIGLSILGLIKLQNVLLYDNGLSQQKSIATHLAMNKIELFRDYQVMNTSAGYMAYQDIVSGSSTTTSAGADFTVTWTVTAYTNPTYKKVDVVVSWTDKYNTAQQVSISTNIASNDPAIAALVM